MDIDYINLSYIAERNNSDAKGNFMIFSDLFKNKDNSAKELIISRFEVQTSPVPAFIWPGDTPDMDILMTNEDQTQDGTEKLVYTPFHDLTDSRYYHMYSINNFLKIVNDGLTEALSILKVKDGAVVGTAPVFYVDGDKINYSVSTDANYRFYFSPMIAKYFQNFTTKLTFDELSNPLIYQEFLYTKGEEIQEAEYPNIGVLLPYKRLEIHSTLNINSENFIESGSSQIEHQYILTDFLLDDFTNPHELKIVSYINKQETRALILEDTKNLRDFSISFFWVTNDNKREIVKMNEGDEFNMKIRLSGMPI
jgi:hypothetical protein